MSASLYRMIIAAGFGMAVLAPMTFSLSAIASTTKAHVAACKRSKTCKMNVFSNGTVDIFTGSGGQVWCPGEPNAKCIIIAPGRPK